MSVELVYLTKFYYLIKLVDMIRVASGLFFKSDTKISFYVSYIL